MTTDIRIQLALESVVQDSSPTIFDFRMLHIKYWLFVFDCAFSSLCFNLIWLPRIRAKSLLLGASPKRAKSLFLGGIRYKLKTCVYGVKRIPESEADDEGDDGDNEGNDKGDGGYDEGNDDGDDEGDAGGDVEANELRILLSNFFRRTLRSQHYILPSYPIIVHNPIIVYQ